MQRRHHGSDIAALIIDDGQQLAQLPRLVRQMDGDTGRVLRGATDLLKLETDPLPRERKGVLRLLCCSK
jgi:hypothetical protein